MIGFVLAILFLIGVGVVLIVRRGEMAEAMSLMSGASAPPGCAVAAGIAFFALAILGVGLYQAGLLGRF